MANILVIGGSGFLGSHVSDMLSKKGNKVYIFDKIISPYLSYEQNMIVGDILDLDLIDKSVKGMDYVYHFAAMADITESKDKPLEAVKFNILGTMNVLESCKKYKVKRFIFSSSVYVYSTQGSFYKTTKQACELLIENYFEEFNLEYTILRYGSLYGTRANNFNFISSIIKQALINGEIERKGDGSEVRDYINVIDAANSSVEILKDDFINAYVMITGDQSRKVKDLLTIIKEIFNDEINIKYLTENYKGHYQLTPYSFRPKVALKLTPKVHHDLGQGILDCIYHEYEKLVNSNIATKFNNFKS